MTALTNALETVAGSNHPSVGGRALQILSKIFEDGRVLGRNWSEVVECFVCAGGEARIRDIVAQDASVHDLGKECCPRHQFRQQARNVLPALWPEGLIVSSASTKRDNHRFAAWRACSVQRHRIKQNRAQAGAGQGMEEITTATGDRLGGLSQAHPADSQAVRVQRRIEYLSSAFAVTIQACASRVNVALYCIVGCRLSCCRLSCQRQIEMSCSLPSRNVR